MVLSLLGLYWAELPWAAAFLNFLVLFISTQRNYFATMSGLTGESASVGIVVSPYLIPCRDGEGISSRI